MLPPLIILDRFNFIFDPNEDFRDKMEFVLCNGGCCGCGVFEIDDKRVLDETLTFREGLLFGTDVVGVILLLLV